MKFFGLGRFVLSALLILLIAQFALSAQEQGQQKPPSPEEMAAKEADRLATLLKLEDWQVFYVDSTLQHDYAEWQAEMESLQKARVDNIDIYTAARDKWSEHIEKTYRRIFTDEQWAVYLKNGAGKEQRARAKRREKAMMSSETSSGKQKKRK